MARLGLVVLGLTWVAVFLGIAACVVAPSRARAGLFWFLGAVSWIWLTEHLNIFAMAPWWMLDTTVRSCVTRALVCVGFGTFLCEWIRSLPRGGQK